MKKRFLYAWACLLFSFAILPAGAHAQQSSHFPQEKPLIEMSKEEAWKFFGWVMEQFDDGKGNTKPLSLWTRDRIGWLFKENQEGRLQFNVYTSGRIRDNQVGYVMAAGFDSTGKANIEMDLSVLGIWFWDSCKNNTPIDRTQFNNLAISLSHEVIHIQHGRLVLQAGLVDLSVRKEEERRTWTTSILEDIRPLLLKGEKVNSHFVQASEAFRMCKGDPYCPAFEKFISGHTKK